MKYLVFLLFAGCASPDLKHYDCSDTMGIGYGEFATKWVMINAYSESDACKMAEFIFEDEHVSCQEWKQ